MALIVEVLMVPERSSSGGVSEMVNYGSSVTYLLWGVEESL